MGQVESATVKEDTDTRSSPSTFAGTGAGNNQQLPAFGALIAEAAAYGNENKNESLEAKAERALECPCIADLRASECGTQFSSAFLCFLKSTVPEKGSDCVNTFVALQSCIKANPKAFSKEDLEGDKVIKDEDEKPVKGYRILPPLWSVYPKVPKSKL